MRDELVREIKRETLALIEKARIPLSKHDREMVTVNDFGLGDVRKEGVQYIDIFLTPAMRITILVLLPEQTLPQHSHPSYDLHPGKEENIRLFFGEMRVYLPGDGPIKAGSILDNKKQYYTARKEVILRPGDGITIEPGINHWFQAGSGGCVTMSFYNRADESRNKFTDPKAGIK